ncbi:hypothetical protein Slin14017_G126850 [Septoria linicola]|nr:hypothetical protein Slin14017_G126850 [Septoria linicola]
MMYWYSNHILYLVERLLLIIGMQAALLNATSLSLVFPKRTFSVMENESCGEEDELQFTIKVVYAVIMTAAHGKALSAEEFPGFVHHTDSLGLSVLW